MDSKLELADNMEDNWLLNPFVSIVLFGESCGVAAVCVIIGNGGYWAAAWFISCSKMTKINIAPKLSL